MSTGVSMSFLLLAGIAVAVVVVVGIVVAAVLIAASGKGRDERDR
jgi:hypothetical protein